MLIDHFNLYCYLNLLLQAAWTFLYTASTGGAVKVFSCVNDILIFLSVFHFDRSGVGSTDFSKLSNESTHRRCSTHMCEH